MPVKSGSGICFLGVTAMFIFCGDALPSKEAAVRAPVITAKQVVQRIKERFKSQWQEKTVDTFKCGDPNTPVTGIAMTHAATFDVLKRAEAAGLNFVISHEPTFYKHEDDTTQLESDEVLLAKRNFVEQHKMVVWRFHDHAHRTRPDGIVAGMVDSLGWRQNLCKGEMEVFEFPRTTLREFAATLKHKFNGAPIRIVGDPEMQFSRVGLKVGSPGSPGQIQMLQRPDVEVLVSGETHEWETVEYVRDAVAAGKPKALILLGHVNSEEAGMDHFTKWLAEFVPEVPVQFIPAGNPFWSPQ